MEGTTIPASVWEQIPIVLVFIVFCIVLLRGFRDFIAVRDKQWQEFLEKQRCSDTDVLEKLVTAVDKLTGRVENIEKQNGEHYAMEEEAFHQLGIKKKQPPQRVKD